jgi:hypothetical protein
MIPSRCFCLFLVITTVPFQSPTYARLAYINFCDDACPLPKAYAGSSLKTTQGAPFPDFYFRGAKLMHAFALLGEAK